MQEMMTTGSVPRIDILKRIHDLERRELEGVAAPDQPPIWGQIERVPLVRVLGQAAFWKNSSDAAYEQRLDDLLTSLYGQGLEFQYLIWGRGKDVAIYVGIQGSDAEVLLRTALTSAYPGIELSETVETSLGRSLSDEGLFAYRGRLTGIPTRKTGPGSMSVGAGQDSQRPYQQRYHGTVSSLPIERLLRGLPGTRWGYFVRANPCRHESIAADAYACLDDIAAAASHTKRQLQRLNQTLTQVNPQTQQGSTESISGEIVDRRAEYAVTLLERHLERLDEGKAVGMWDVEAHFFAADAQTLARVQALLRAVFGGPESSPEPIRATRCGRAGGQGSDFVTRLTSVELSTLCQLPQEEVPGYRITDYASFDVDLNPVEVSTLVSVGMVLDGKRKTGLAYTLPREDFAKHGLVAGVTGSGKTNTIFALLEQLWDGGQGHPFLVIEPAKAEYRELRGPSRSDGRGKGPIPDLRVYTLGDETVAPFRLNPFEFEVSGPEQRIHIQTHIDYLKSVFNAAFILYAPMPYVLETCLHEIYQDKGWDLTTSRNRRLPSHLWGLESRWPVFPTLSDLYEKIDEVTERLGYEERIEMDVKAGLKARIGSLRLGGKGLMLDTQYSVPMAELLTAPTVLELERIGNDDEKAFLIGLILTRLYEYRRVQANTTSVLTFQHLTVIEEAHRLLKNVPTEVETEAANARGQAVETFANMLAEIRAYGQGVLVAEQVPTKLTPDVIKNTNLKIIHRVVAEDDRQVLGGTMNMNEAQERFLITLPPGQAVVYAEGADHPYLVQVENYKKHKLRGRPDDADVSAATHSLTHRALYDSVPDASYYLTDDRQKPVDAYIHDLVSSVMARPDYPEVWSRFFLNLVLEPAQVMPAALAPLQQLLTQMAGDLSSPQVQRSTLMLLLRTAAMTLQTRARYYRWSYDRVEALRQQLVAGLAALVAGRQADASRLLTEFADTYRRACALEQGPFAGCAACRERCLYRHDVMSVVRDRIFEQEFVSTIQRNEEDTALWMALATLSREAGARLIGPVGPAETANAALCIAVQVADRLNFNRSTQRKVADSLVNLLLVGSDSRGQNNESS